MKNKKGFTLIELLVVIAIIGILATIVIAFTSGARAKGRTSASLSTMKSMLGPLQLCVNDGVAVNMPTDTNNGGGGVVCTGSSNSYLSLASGWIWCDSTSGTQGAANCGNDVSSQSTGASWTIVAESNADSQKITCSSTTYTCVATSDSD